eukprot:Opistho-1_new@4747
MIPEIGSKKPGFTTLLLRIKRDKNIHQAGFFHRLLNGTEEQYQYIPVTAYQFGGDSIVYQQFVDEGVTERAAVLRQLAADLAVISVTYHLGTDKFGRDILSRLMIPCTLR